MHQELSTVLNIVLLLDVSSICFTQCWQMTKKQHCQSNLNKAIQTGLRLVSKHGQSYQLNSAITVLDPILNSIAHAVMTHYKVFFDKCFWSVTTMEICDLVNKCQDISKSRSKFSMAYPTNVKKNTLLPHTKD